MSDAEQIILLAFLLSLGVAVAAPSSTRGSFGRWRGMLAANAVIAVAVYAIGAGWSMRGAAFHAVLALGASDAGCWAALGLGRVLPDRATAPRAGKALQDRWRDGILLAAAAAMFVVLGLADPDDETAAIDAVEIPTGQLPPL